MIRPLNRCLLLILVCCLPVLSIAQPPVQTLYTVEGDRLPIAVVPYDLCGPYGIYLESEVHLYDHTCDSLAITDGCCTFVDSIPCYWYHVNCPFEPAQFEGNVWTDSLDRLWHQNDVTSDYNYRLLTSTGTYWDDLFSYAEDENGEGWLIHSSFRDSEPNQTITSWPVAPPDRIQRFFMDVYYESYGLLAVSLRQDSSWVTYVTDGDLSPPFDSLVTTAPEPPVLFNGTDDRIWSSMYWFEQNDADASWLLMNRQAGWDTVFTEALLNRPEFSYPRRLSAPTDGIRNSAIAWVENTEDEQRQICFYRNDSLFTVIPVDSVLDIRLTGSDEIQSIILWSEFDGDSTRLKASLIYRSNGGVSEQQASIPTIPMLHDPYPNPFNSMVRLSAELPLSGTLTLTVFDILGRKVQEVTRPVHQGLFSRSLVANGWPSGSYFVRWTLDGKVLGTQHLLLVK